MAETKKNKGAEASAKLVNDLTSWLKNLTKKKNKKERFSFDYDAQRAKIKKLAESKNMKNLSESEVKKVVKEKLSGRDFEKPLPKSKRLESLPEGKTVKVLNPKALKKGMGGKATVSPNQKSRQATLPKEKKEDSVGKEIARALLGPQKKSKIGKLTADSTDRGMSKFMGTDKEIADQEMDEEMNFRKGGMPSKKTYGMRAGGFTKRGGMYKKGY